MEKAVSIKTSAGILNGRDCIFLDTAVQDESKKTVVFTGDTNRIPYKLTFMRVLSCFFCELDTYENLVDTKSNSSFDLIENSAWLESLPIRKDYDKSAYKHYRLFTYDIVYDIIAMEYTLEI
jgi:hypothetical protein